MVTGVIFDVSKTQGRFQGKINSYTNLHSLLLEQEKKGGEARKELNTVDR